PSRGSPGRRGSSPSASPSRLARREVTEIAPEEQLRELLRQLGQRLELLDAGLPSLGVAGAQRRRHELVQQAGLAVCGGAERPQVPRRDAVAGELGARDSDVDVRRRIVLLAALAARVEQTVLLELARQVGRDRGPLAE